MLNYLSQAKIDEEALRMKNAEAIENVQRIAKERDEARTKPKRKICGTFISTPR
jgi:hypothetical protein